MKPESRNKAPDERRLKRLRRLLTFMKQEGVKPVHPIDIDTVQEKGARKGERRRVTYLDRLDFYSRENEHRITVATRAPDGQRGTGIALHDHDGNPRLGFLVDETGKPGIQLLDERGVERLHIGLGRDGVPAILFFDAKGRESFALSDVLFRWGRLAEDRVEIDRDKSVVRMQVKSGKGKAVALMGMVNRQPCIALSDSKNRNQVGMTADPKFADLAILQKGKRVWGANHRGQKEQPAKINGRHG